ncbi:hypothetical protein [Porphyromonas loveana]|uniref:hypothetical protein n=1 Tax=Porphyromonas loveana TaxID=1884669 RepID=UPI0035A0A0F9
MKNDFSTLRTFTIVSINLFRAFAGLQRVKSSFFRSSLVLEELKNRFSTHRTFAKSSISTFVEGITVSRKYQLKNQETIKPNEVDKTPSGCANEENFITLQQTSDTFCPTVKQMSEHVLTITGAKIPRLKKHYGVNR